MSPYLYSRGSSAQPSPLSQVAGQHTWTEDEKDEEDSPSPASTDSDSSHNGGLPRGHSRQASASSFTRATPSRPLSTQTTATSRSPTPTGPQKKGALLRATSRSRGGLVAAQTSRHHTCMRRTQSIFTRRSRQRVTRMGHSCTLCSRNPVMIIS